MGSSNVINYDDYAKKASLKGEFVRIIHKDNSISEDEKSEIIDCGLKFLSGEEIEL